MLSWPWEYTHATHLSYSYCYTKYEQRCVKLKESCQGTDCIQIFFSVRCAWMRLGAGTLAQKSWGWQNVNAFVLGFFFWHLEKRILTKCQQRCSSFFPQKSVRVFFFFSSAWKMRKESARVRHESRLTTSRETWNM